MADFYASDYQVLRDGPMKLGAGEDSKQQLNLNITNNFASLGGRRNYGVIIFKIQPSENAHLTVEAIGSGPTTIVNNSFFTKSHTRVYQEAFDLAGIVTKTSESIGTPIGNLLIEFSVKNGPVTISDVVIHYKVHVAL